MVHRSCGDFPGCDGERQGKALADALVGDLNPCGKMTITFPNLVADLPAFTTKGSDAIPYEKPTEGRGYPYYIGKNKAPLIPFGFGLSYTNYTYSNLQVPSNAVIGDTVVVTVDITNTGTNDGVEIPQLYITETSPAAARPVKQLRGFARLTIPTGQKNGFLYFEGMGLCPLDAGKRLDRRPEQQLHHLCG